MSLFHKAPQHVTVMLCIVVFGDGPSHLPKNDQATYAKFVSGLLETVIQTHYYERLRPPKKWNCNYDTYEIPVDYIQQLTQFQFRDPKTGEIRNQQAYRTTVNTMKETWRSKLQKNFPRYDRTKMEESLESLCETYDSKRQILTLSILLDEAVPLNKERFTT